MGRAHGDHDYDVYHVERMFATRGHQHHGSRTSFEFTSLSHLLITIRQFEGILLETRGAFQDPTAWYSFKGANDRTLAQAAIFSFEVRSNLQTSSFFIVYCATSVHDRRWRRRVARRDIVGLLLEMLDHHAPSTSRGLG